MPAHDGARCAAIPVAAAGDRHACAWVWQAPVFRVFFDVSQVHVGCFLEQHGLFASGRFTGLAEADSAVVGQFVRQRGDLDVILDQHCPYLRQEGRINIGIASALEAMPDG